MRNLLRSDLILSLQGFCRYILVTLLFLSTSLHGDQTASGQSLIIEQNCSKAIEMAEQINEVLVANPDIADVQVSGGSSVNIFGRKPGNTTVVVTNNKYKIIAKYDVRITHNISDLANTAKKVYPKEKVQFDSTPAGIIVKGEASSPSVAKNIEDIASDYMAPGQKTRNLMSVSGSTQVMLKVKVAEVRRSVLNSLAINWAAIANSPAHFTYGILTGRNGFANGSFTPSDASPIPGTYGARYDNGSGGNYTALLDALDSEGLGTVLAEPNLITTSGETASFLVGGEFPYPVPQNQNITIEFKKYGISLAFTPTVLADSRIFLKVRPEVSELDYANALSFMVGNNSVVKLPGIKTNVVETSVELGAGDSLAIAGLLSTSLVNDYSDLPGFADIPVLGALFRSSSFQRQQTELVVIVTPHIVTPTTNPHALKLPTENLRHASALEALLHKRLNRPYSKEGVENVSFDAAHKLHGSAGFNVE